MIKKIFLICLVVVCPGLNPGSVSAISVSQSLDKSTIPFKDSAIFEITLRWDGPQTAYYFEKPLNPYIDRLKVRGFTASISSSQETEGEVTTKQYRYVLIPTSSGQGRIDPVSISYISWPDSVSGELVTEPMLISIEEPLPVASSGSSELGWSDVVIVLSIIGLGSLLILAVVGWFLVKNRKPKPAALSPKEELLKALTAAKSDAGSDLKKFQTGVHKIMGDYLVKTFAIHSDRLPPAELSDRLRQKGLSEEAVGKITGWLERAQRDKFSPVSNLPGETIRLESEIRAFFEKS